MTKFDPNAVYDPKGIKDHDYMWDVLEKNCFIDSKELKERQEEGIANLYFDSTGVKTKDKGMGKVHVLDANDTVYLRTGEKELVALTAKEFITDTRFYPNKSPSEKLALLQKASSHEIYSGRSYGGRALEIDPEFQEFVNSLKPTKAITDKAVSASETGVITSIIKDGIKTGADMALIENLKDSRPQLRQLQESSYLVMQPEWKQALFHAVTGVMSYIFPN